MAYFAELDKDNKVLRVLKFYDQDIENNGGDYTAESEQWIVDSGTPFSTAEQSPSGQPGVKWKQTSINTSYGKHLEPDNGQGERAESADQSKAKRFRFAGVGAIYDESLDAFIPPREYDSWTWNDTTLEYDPPVARPTVEVIEVDGEQVSLVFSWHEPKVTWKGYNKEKDLTKYWNPNTNTWEDDYVG